jgi:hypothetical protein
VFYIPGAVYLWRYAASIRRLLRVQSVAALDEALVNQKSLFKYMAMLGLPTLFALRIGGNVLERQLPAQGSSRVESRPTPPW